MEDKRGSMALVQGLNGVSFSLSLRPASCRTPGLRLPSRSFVSVLPLEITCFFVSLVWFNCVTACWHGAVVSSERAAAYIHVCDRRLVTARSICVQNTPPSPSPRVQAGG